MDHQLILALLVAACIMVFPTTDCAPDVYFMDQYCDGNTATSDIFLDKGSILMQLKEDYSKYHPNMECEVNIRTDKLFLNRMMVKVLRIHLDDSTFCETDSLQIYDGSSTSSPELTGLFGICGYVPPISAYVTSEEWVTLKFKSSVFAGPHRGFKLLITLFDDDFLCPKSTEFRCSFARCIDDSSVCDGYDNCPDGTDERLCGVGVGGLVGIVLSSCALLVILVISLKIMIERSRRNRRILLGIQPVQTQRTHLCTGSPDMGYGSPIAGQFPAQGTLPPPYNTLYSTPVKMPSQAESGSYTNPEHKQIE